MQRGEYRVKVAPPTASGNALHQVCISVKDYAPNDGLPGDERRRRLLAAQVAALDTLERECQCGAQPTTLLQQLLPQPKQQPQQQQPKQQQQQQQQPKQQPKQQRSKAADAGLDGDLEDEQEEDGPELDRPTSALEIDNVVHQGVPLDADETSMSKEQLAGLVRALRSYIGSWQAAKQLVDEQLLRKIASNQTVGYIKTLEEGLETYRQSFKQETERHRQLRIAYDSLQRRDPRPLAPRPASAASGH